MSLCIDTNSLLCKEPMPTDAVTLQFTFPAHTLASQLAVSFGFCDIMAGFQGVLSSGAFHGDQVFQEWRACPEAQAEDAPKTPDPARLLQLGSKEQEEEEDPSLPLVITTESVADCAAATGQEEWEDMDIGFP